MPIQGLRDTSNFVAEQRPKNWREAVMLLYPNGKAPLTAFTTMMKSKSTDDPEYNWWEKQKANQRLALSAQISAAAAVLPVAAGALNFKEGHILRIEETEEVVLVTADPTSDTQIPVQRGYGGTAATAVNPATAGVNPNFHAIGVAHEEGSNPPTGVNYDPAKAYNYTQIFRDTLEMTRTASKTRLRTGDQVKEAKRECLEIHSGHIEKSLIFGKRVETTKNGKPFRTTGGILSFIDSNNVVTAAGAAGNTMEDLENWMKSIFLYGSSEKIAFGGNTSLLAIQQILRKNAQWHFQSGIKEYGMNVSRLTSPFGELVLKTHPLFNELPGGTNTSAYYGLDSWLLVVDQQELVYRYIDDTTYQKSLEANGLDGMQSGYLTECGLEIHHPKTHFLIKKLVKGKVDA